MKKRSQQDSAKSEQELVNGVSLVQFAKAIKDEKKEVINTDRNRRKDKIQAYVYLNRLVTKEHKDPRTDKTLRPLLVSFAKRELNRKKKKQLDLASNEWMKAVEEEKALETKKKRIKFKAAIRTEVKKLKANPHIKSFLEKNGKTFEELASDPRVIKAIVGRIKL